MSLMNIRISAEEKKMAAELRAQGVKMSELFRRTLREEHSRRCAPRESKKSVRKIMEEIYKKYPLTPDTPFHGINPANRHELRKYIQDKLNARRSKR